MPTFRSFAKINLHLEVVGRRPDGFHELRTVFQTVSLADRIGVDLSTAGVELLVTGASLPTGTDNLVHRAASQFLDRWGDGRGVRLHLDKRIPIGGGLGGGSSNAATTLLALRRLLGRPGDASELVDLAAELGADVPYFLTGGTAIGRGRGDEIEALPDLAREELLLVDPGVGVSTAEIFQQGRFRGRSEPHPRLREAAAGTLTHASTLVGINDLEEVVFERYPRVKAIYNALVQSGCEQVRMSGSGATLFAFCAGDEEGGVAAALPDGSRVLRVSTLSRASIAEQRVVDALEEPDGDH